MRDLIQTRQMSGEYCTVAQHFSDKDPKAVHRQIVERESKEHGDEVNCPAQSTKL